MLQLTEFLNKWFPAELISDKFVKIGNDYSYFHDSNENAFHYDTVIYMTLEQEFNMEYDEIQNTILSHLSKTYGLEIEPYVLSTMSLHFADDGGDEL